MIAASLPADNSYAALSPHNPGHRLPRAAGRRRPPEFTAAFDARTLFYDCFWHADCKRILLVGPPPYGIAYAGVKIIARPSGLRLAARRYRSLSVMLTAVAGAPADTVALEVTLAGESHALAVQPNSCSSLAGARLLFSVSRDNDLAWIGEWAEFHARVHGTNAIVLVDNGSSRYEPRQVLDTLARVPGIVHAAVPSWPYPFGPRDPAVMKDDYWARFLQIGAMSMVLRRYGERADGLLNCDVDELAGTHSGRPIYDLAKHSTGGLVVFRGTWIEAAGEGTRHRDFTRRLADTGSAQSPQRKWVLDPSRRWVRRLSVHPYWHWIEGRALFAKSMPPDSLYWHFKAINSNWKEDRARPPAGALVEDELLRSRFAMLERRP